MLSKNVFPMGLPIAVVVPVLNEAPNLRNLLPALVAAGFAQVIIADGGSSDESVAIAEAAGVITVQGVRGRGAQMNAGARQASVSILVFLHADTVLPPEAPALIERALRDPSIVGGCFRLRFDQKNALLGFYGLMSRFETALTTFGDQAYFVRAAAFKEAGGFPEWPFLEDVELRRRLLRLGRFVKLPICVTTSARRFEGEGVLRRQLMNAWILALHRCGLSADRLVRWYRPKR